MAAEPQYPYHGWYDEDRPRTLPSDTLSDSRDTAIMPLPSRGSGGCVPSRALELGCEDD